MYYDSELTRNLGLGARLVQVGYYWVDGTTIKSYVPTYMATYWIMGEYSHGIDIQEVCDVLNNLTKTEEEYSYLPDRPPHCFIVRGATDICIVPLMKDHTLTDYTVPAGAAEVLGIPVKEEILLPGGIWDVVIVEGELYIWLVTAYNETISCGYVPIKRMPHFFVVDKEDVGIWEVHYTGSWDDCCLFKRLNPKGIIS